MKRSALKHDLREIHDHLLRAYGPQKCCLDHTTPFELLCATILSAQCTDKKVNSITPELFRKYPDPQSLADADRSELEDLIHPCGFFHAKAGNLIGMAKKIVGDFHGEVPASMEELTSLPGVGRKTANVVLGDAFGIPGLPVDTHVTRIMNLTGAVHTEDAVAIEAVLCGALEPSLWSEFSHLVIIHGRNRCPARRPDCQNCEIRQWCDHGAAAEKPKGKTKK